MKRFALSLLMAACLSARAEAELDRAASVARSQAAGGAFVSLADDVSAIFLNPAGLSLAGRAAAEAEYAEPADMPGAREARAALSVASGKTTFGFGCYRGWDGGTDDLLLTAGVARTLFEAGGASFISVGANVAFGDVERRAVACPAEEGTCPEPGPSGSGVTGDVGVILKPLPVISFGYAAANVLDVHLEGSGGAEAWRCVQRWGMSYFWENRLVVSLSGETAGGQTTMHYGVRLRTAVPVELLAGFSAGHATGGVAWQGARLGALVAFSSGEGGVVTWIGALEVRLPGTGAR